MRLWILFLMFLTPFRLFSQNIIANPDFSDVTIVYQNGKKVYPSNWKSFDSPFPSFYHPLKEESEDIFAKQSNSQNSKGIIGLHITHPSEGIFTKLKEPLILGQNYDIQIEIRLEKLKLNSDIHEVHNLNSKTIVDSSQLDYNFPIDLITCFSPTKFSSESKGNRTFVIFDLSSYVSSDTSKWIKISKSYLAKGNEQYFAIGTWSTNDYIKILRDTKKDTLDYSHKFAYYSIRNISISPQLEDKISDLKIVNDFDSLSLNNIEETFVFLKVNFQLNSYKLNEKSKRELTRIAVFMKGHLDLNLHLIGHTDTVGTLQYNQTLSEERAKEVYKYLYSQGINITRLSYEGKGELSPLDNNHWLENLGRNRRVEFKFKKRKN